MLLPFALIFLSLGSVADVDSLLSDLLSGGEADAADVQRALCRTLHWTTVSPSGITVSGKRAAVLELGREELQSELGDGVAFLQYFSVGGEGPEPLRVHVPADANRGAIEVYRRVEPGLFLRTADPPVRYQNHVFFEASFPGEFVVREEDEDSHVSAKGLFPEYPTPDMDPSRKEVWRLFPVAPQEVAGPVPLVLIHGAGMDRWGEFIHWARFSPEAEEFRQHYQLWNFSHNMYAINAPIGFDRNCPQFEESIVTYLARFVQAAERDGVNHAGQPFYFPPGPFSMLTNSHGALKARAFMVHYPEYGERVLAVVTLGGPHMGSPWASPEWIRYSASRLGLFKPNWAERIAQDGMDANYISLQSQSDLDMGWANYDMDGGFGLPHRSFDSWDPELGRVKRVISPRDANRTGAREWPGYEDDTTFEPDPPLETYCGGMDQITPTHRGGMYMDRFFLYGSYIEPGRGWLRMLLTAGDGVMDYSTHLYENVALRVTHALMGLVESPGGRWPNSPYRMGDGFVPLQSQLMLDGQENRPVFETRTLLGWQSPVLPLRPDMEVIRAHTLANPDRLRIFPGWSHLETTTGRYNKETKHSELFSMVAEDLLSVLPSEQ